jgi:hypothetical protein
MTRTYIGALIVAVGAVILAPGSSAQSKSPLVVRGPTVVQAQRPPTDVHQLANRVRKVIKLVEENATISCEMRNHLVRRLRMLNNTLEAGDRTAARAMVIAWTSEARSYQRAGLFSAAHGAILHNGLQGFMEEIGSGAPNKPGPTRKWEPLPACEADATSGVTGALAGSTYDPFDANDTLLMIQGVVGMVPGIGPLLAGLVGVFWPAGDVDVSALIDKQIDQATIDNVILPALKGLRSGLSPYDGFLKDKEAWQNTCAKSGQASDLCKSSTQNIFNSWRTMRTEFVTSRSSFQTDREDYQVMLLPLFAQYETLYLSFLREGVLMAPAWIASGQVGPSEAAEPAEIMADELNPDFVNPDTNKKDRGLAYVNLVYERGLAAHPEPSGSNKWDQWIERNGYIRRMTLQVLDFSDTWKFIDPAAYPQGVPGGVRLTRMIYSDPVGHKRDDDFGSFVPPANVAGPLKELTVWSQVPPTGSLAFGSTLAISAIQSTNPPTAGPARSGEITGDSTHDGRTHVDYLDLRTSGPITKVGNRRDRRNTLYRWVPSQIDFWTPATGKWFHTGDKGYYETINFSYSGHVLAAAKAMGLYDMGTGMTTDSVIFGFRYADSFFPSGSLLSVASGKCMDVRSFTAGTPATIYSCFGGQGQIWTYDTNTRAVTIGDSARCLRATGTTNGSPVVIDACTGATNQQWELVASANGLSGMVKAVESGLALDVSGGNTADRTPIVLWSPHGGTSQLWTITSPLQGEIHGVGSGRCLDVRSGGTADHTPVQIYDCNGTAAQAWTYDEFARTLSVNHGTKCLNAPGGLGAALEILDCAAVSGHHEWVFNRDRTITHMATGFLLDVQAGGMTNGSLAILSLPSARTSQYWSRPSRRGGNVHAMHAGKCLDVPSIANGAAAQISDCLAAPAPGQEWTYHPLTQRLTVHSAGTEYCLSTAGSAAVIAECVADPNQLWALRASGVGGTMVNAASGLCMTLPGTGTITASGTKVELQGCASEPVNPNQQWIWP